jgi:ATP-dependent DNA helicase RecG
MAVDPQHRDALQTAFGLSDRQYFRRTYLEPLLTAGWLERTIPDKPTSPNQRYRIAGAGRAWLERQES